jgi:hypothetical protein
MPFLLFSLFSDCGYFGYDWLTERYTIDVFRPALFTYDSLPLLLR